MGGLPQRISAEDLAPPTRSLFEALAERLQLDAGHTKFEALFKDGRLTLVHTNEKIGATALGRFDRVALTNEILLDMERRIVALEMGPAALGDA